jgi:hypothetical protein
MPYLRRSCVEQSRIPTQTQSPFIYLAQKNLDPLLSHYFFDRLSTYGNIGHIKFKRIPNHLRSKQEREEDKDREFQEGVVLEMMQFTVFCPTRFMNRQV